MKKEITILQENASPIVVDDSDDRALKEYTDDLAKLFDSNNISIIHTSSCSIITRPNKVTSVIVREYPSQPSEDMQTQMKKVEDVEEESPDGIISD